MVIKCQIKGDCYSKKVHVGGEGGPLSKLMRIVVFHNDEDRDLLTHIESKDHL